MAEASISVAEDPVICSICLDLLKDPVTIPFGHSYCMSCITDYWNKEDQKRIYSCPHCRQTFTPRPDIYKNIILAKVVEDLKKTKQKTARPFRCYAASGVVECGVCIDKLCLVCLNLYCQNHLKEHDCFFQDERHGMNVTGRLQEMIPVQGGMMDEHKNHKSVSAAAESIESFQSLVSPSGPDSIIIDNNYTKKIYGRGACAVNPLPRAQNWTEVTTMRKWRLISKDLEDLKQ